MDLLEREQIDALSVYIDKKGKAFNRASHVNINEPRFIIMGDHVQIGEDCSLEVEGGLIIGNHVTLERRVNIYTNKKSPFPHFDSAPVIIEDGVYIEENVSIASGITIGQYARVLANTRVTKDIPAFAVVGEQGIEKVTPPNISSFSPPLVSKLKYIQSKTKFFFIVGTGRSGSTSIAKILNTHPEINCLHEPNPLLIRLSSEYAHFQKNEVEVRKELAYMYGYNDIFPAGLYGESDQKLSNMISLLADLIPQAKFIWLIRRAEDVVASTYIRDWFHDQENEMAFDKKTIKKYWMWYRLNGALSRDLSETEWNSMSAFDRNCWYWTFWNKRIEQQLNNLPRQQWMQVKLEELEDNLDTIQQFLGLSPQEIVVKQLNSSKGKPYHINTWSVEEKAKFDFYCEALMNKWYD